MHLHDSALHAFFMQMLNNIIVNLDHVHVITKMLLSHAVVNF